MRHRAVRLAIVPLLVPALLIAGCGPTLRRSIRSPAELASVDKNTQFLNAHMRDGSMIALQRWSLDSTGARVEGVGERRDPDRRLVSRGPQSFPIDSVALFEASTLKRMSPAMQAITIVLVSAGIVVGVSLLAIAIACASNPKCFGSCPTFYVTNGEHPMLQAEGFSASVAPALEATDIDALYRARPAGRELEVVMKNEALETHVVRFVNVLAAERPGGARVFATPGGEFWLSGRWFAPAAASGPEGDCRAALADFDSLERVSAPDSSDLAAREEVDLRFAEAPDGPAGLVIASRQTLLTTYLYYQTLAYMGGSAGRWMAALERGDRTARERSTAIGRELGGIDVLVANEAGDFLPAGTSQETGPLATDVRLVPLPRLAPGPVRIRLSMTRGLWRLDWVALARLDRRVDPVRLEPVDVRRGAAADEAAREALLDPSRTLITGPGDAYTLVYRLPESFERCELFLESRGYYLEWMREKWLAQEDPGRAAMVLLNPRRALRELAPAYARELPALNDWFWKSRYVHP